MSYGAARDPAAISGGRVHELWHELDENLSFVSREGREWHELGNKLISVPCECETSITREK